jgi:hypothetical protein
MQKMERKMTFFGMTVSKVARVLPSSENESATKGSLDEHSD